MILRKSQIMNIPQGYKQTELGIIPKDWEVISIKERGCLVKDGINPMLSPNVSFWEYSMPAFDNGKQPTLSLGEEMHSNRTIIRDTVLLFNKLNVRQQRVWFVESPSVDSVCSMEFLPYVSKSINLEFLFHYLKTDVVTDYFNGISKGTSNSQKRITPQDFLDYKVILPPIAEQRAIAEALSDVDGLIAALDKKIAKKRLLKQGAMCKLLSLSGRGKKWFNTRLGNVVSIRKGSMLTSDRFVAGNIPVIAGGKIPAGYHNVANRPANTITISASGASAGYVALYNKPIFATDCSTIEPCSTYDIHYIYHLLKYYQSEIFAMQTGGAQPHVHPSDLNELQILYAKDIDEQQAIATILSDMDKEIADLEAQRDKYRLLKSGMMQKLLTGQIRLKTE